MIFSKRSYKKEFLDEENIAFADIRQNMQELDFINKWLGGHQITINAFKHLCKEKKKITVCEVGCGGGDNLAAIYNWSRKKNIELNILGIDIKKECIDFAKTRKNLPDSAQWIHSDYSQVEFTQKPDIIFSSLFCHHFTDEQLIFQFRWMMQSCQIGFFVNDLHRHFLAYYSIKFLTRFFSRSYLVKNDAPLSVARGFSKYELADLCERASLVDVEISWKWAFRFVLLYQHKHISIV